MHLFLPIITLSATQAAPKLALNPPATITYKFEETRTVSQERSLGGSLTEKEMLVGESAQGTMTSSFKKVNGIWVEERKLVSDVEMTWKDNQWLPDGPAAFAGEAPPYRRATVTYANGYVRPRLLDRYTALGRDQTVPWWASGELQTIQPTQQLTVGAKWSVTIPASEIQSYHQDVLKSNPASANWRATVTSSASVNFEVRRFTDDRTAVHIQSRMVYTWNLTAQGQTSKSEVNILVNGLYELESGTLRALGSTVQSKADNVSSVSSKT